MESERLYQGLLVRVSVDSERPLARGLSSKLYSFKQPICSKNGACNY